MIYDCLVKNYDSSYFLLSKLLVSCPAIFVNLLTLILVGGEACEEKPRGLEEAYC